MFSRRPATNNNNAWKVSIWVISPMVQWIIKVSMGLIKGEFLVGTEICEMREAGWEMVRYLLIGWWLRKFAVMSVCICVHVSCVCVCMHTCVHVHVWDSHILVKSQSIYRASTADLKSHTGHSVSSATTSWKRYSMFIIVACFAD